MILILILIALGVSLAIISNNHVNTISISDKSNTLTETKPAITPKEAKTAHQPKDSYTRLPYMKDRPVKLGYSLVTVKAINAPYTRDFLEIKELPHSLTEVNVNSASGDYSYHYYLTSDRVIEIAYSWGYGPITGKNDPALKKQFAKARQEIVDAGYGKPTAENGLKCQWKAADGHTVTLKCEVPNNSKWVLFETKITADK